MRTVIITFSFILFTSLLNGQKIKVDNQINFHLRQLKSLDSIGIHNPDFKIIDLQIRIWFDNYSNGNRKLLIISQLKEKKWIALKLSFNCFDLGNCTTAYILDTLTIPETWDNIWQIIIKKDYLNLKTQIDLDKLNRIKSGEVMLIGDGISYTIEILTKKSKHKFDFSNPKDYYEFYKSNGIDIKGYADFNDFISLIKSTFTVSD